MLLIPLVPVLYVLSVGPAFACFGATHQAKLVWFYAPVVWAVNHSDWFRAAVNLSIKLLTG